MKADRWVTTRKALRKRVLMSSSRFSLVSSSYRKWFSKSCLVTLLKKEASVKTVGM